MLIILVLGAIYGSFVLLLSFYCMELESNVSMFFVLFNFLYVVCNYN